MRSSRPAVLLLLAALAVGCGGNGGRGAGPGDDAASAEVGAATLSARPGDGSGACKPGLHELSLPGGGKALLRVGPGGTSRPRPFILTLHGAGDSPRDALWAFRGANDEPVVLLAPAAGDDGWSLRPSGDGDVARIDRALVEAFARCRIDRDHIAIGGFSAGASYALSLGLVNGDLFDAVIALSPGGVVIETRNGSPRIFVAHGTNDRRIPIEEGAGAIVQTLRAAGYAVDFHRFDGGHEVPRDVSEAAISWFLEGSAG